MKKLAFILVALIAINTQAQGRKNLSPEQSATLHSKEMTLQLDLTNKQQEAVYELLEQQAVKRQSMRKVSKEDLSDDERYEMRVQRLNSQITYQNNMKDILDEKQFEQWKETRKGKAKSMHKKGSKEHHKKGRKS